MCSTSAEAQPWNGDRSVLAWLESSARAAFSSDVAVVTDCPYHMCAGRIWVGEVRTWKDASSVRRRRRARVCDDDTKGNDEGTRRARARFFFLRAD